MFVAFLLMGLGAGTAFMPLLTIAMADVPARDAGVASALVNVSLYISGALGLAALGAIATDRTQTLTAQGLAADHALVAGYQLAFVVAAACVLATVAVALVVLRARAAGAGGRSRKRLSERHHRGKGAAAPRAVRGSVLVAAAHRGGLRLPHTGSQRAHPFRRPARRDEGRAIRAPRRTRRRTTAHASIRDGSLPPRCPATQRRKTLGGRQTSLPRRSRRSDSRRSGPRERPRVAGSGSTGAAVVVVVVGVEVVFFAAVLVDDG